MELAKKNLVPRAKMASGDYSLQAIFEFGDYSLESKKSANYKLTHWIVREWCGGGSLPGILQGGEQAELAQDDGLHQPPNGEPLLLQLYLLDVLWEKI